MANAKKIYVNGKLEKPLAKHVIPRAIDWERIAKQLQAEAEKK